MSDKVYRSGIWAYIPETKSYSYYAPGYYYPGEQHEASISIPDDMSIDQLIKALEDSGRLKPRLDDRLRSEDLKITHRLLDILESKVN